ncbi:TetR/AcrR family transcriptional regulator [Arthrobacter sp. UM1]|uniref:TetR/AcrR family transcriptional regulator n=1 Tax=Arthrobacter sp. UM1 TaxID=2766776 RepID=UPI001CF6400B|nr:TetR/AcrR family transcriptional regulator [Arthrobacter sp. UM1]
MNIVRTNVSASPSRSLRCDAQYTRALILNAAKTVFSSMPHASLTNVASAAGVSRATIYRYFGGLDGLVTSLREYEYFRAIESIRDAQRIATCSLSKLYRLTFNLIDNGHLFSAVSIDGRGGSPFESRDSRILEEYLTSLLMECRESGQISSHLDLSWVCRVYFAVVQSAGQLPDQMDSNEKATLAFLAFFRGNGREIDF